MPRGIKGSGKAKATKVKGIPAAPTTTTNTGAPEVGAVSGDATKALPEFHGHKVVQVLDEGHTATHRHCKLDDGTTAHIPNELF